MIELGFAVVVLIIAVVVFLKIRKEKLADITTNQPLETTNPITQPSSEQQNPPLNSVSEPVAAQLIKKPACSTSVENHPNLPQDSVLRRHYLSQIRVMVESINSPRPTDSSLSRHYDTEITRKIQHYLTHKASIEQLISQYENNKKKLTAPIVKNAQTTIPTPTQIETTAVIKDSKIPEDSVLSRHYGTQLYAQITADLSPRPTDSTLRRHYDSMIESKIQSQLN